MVDLSYICHSYNAAKNAKLDNELRSLVQLSWWYDAVEGDALHPELAGEDNPMQVLYALQE